MKCEKCAAFGDKSKVYSDGASSTLIGGGGEMWDEDGVSHYHNPNTTSTGYHCNKGHRWSIKGKSPCWAKGCDYGGGQEIVYY